MAEFVQVMRDLHRMCRYKAEDCLADDSCPMGKYGGEVVCNFAYKDGIDYADMEKIVEAWAEEHPELAFPTWGEWFSERGELIDGYNNATNTEFVLAQLKKLMNSEIPCDVAAKLEILPWQ